MATKKSVIEALTVKSYGYDEVKHLINTITVIESTPPKTIKKGDVYSSYQGVKRRPVCVIKVLDGVVYGIPMTTTKDKMFLCEHNSRFFRDGYFTNQIVSASVEYVNYNFLGVLDDTKNINVALKMLKELFNKL